MKKTLGVCEWCLPVRGPALMKTLKRCGIDAFQVDTGLYEEGIPMIFPEVQACYLEAASDAGITLNSAGNMSLCDYGMVHPHGSPKQDAAKEIIEKSLRALAAMNIPIFMLQSFFDGEITDEDSFQNTAKLLKWTCELAADKGIAISWENALPVEDNLRLIEIVGMDNFGIGFDTQNPHAFKGYYVPDMIRALAGHINMVHIKDGVKDGEDPNLGMAHYGDGNSDFAESVRALKEIGFDGAIVSENSYNETLFYQKAGDPFKAIREDVKRFAAAFAD